MEDMYRFHDVISSSSRSSENIVVGVENNQFYTPSVLPVPVVDDNNKQLGVVAETDDQVVVDGMMMITKRLELSDLIKTQIANHPRYPDLVSAHIQCRKVGAPPEMALLLDEIGRENQPNSRISEIGADPELDEFMESYCEVLHKYKIELSKPFDEATTFLSNIESQLSNLCKGGLTTAGNYHSDEAGGSSEEELSCGEAEASESQACSDPRLSDQELKERLLQKYSGYLSSLRKEFLKKRKKGKLPKDARTTLLDWWNAHYRWPYPTEEEKMKLSEITGLDQKQINNWFINQRKRHWKPSEDMRFALMEGGDNGGGTL